MVCPATGATRGVALAHWRLGLLSKRNPKETDIYLVEMLGGVGSAPHRRLRRDHSARARRPLRSDRGARSRVAASARLGCPCTTDGMTITWFFEPVQTDLDELLSGRASPISNACSGHGTDEQRESPTMAMVELLCGCQANGALPGDARPTCDVVIPRGLMVLRGAPGLVPKTGGGTDHWSFSGSPYINAREKLRRVTAVL